MIPLVRAPALFLLLLTSCGGKSTSVPDGGDADSDSDADSDADTDTGDVVHPDDEIFDPDVIHTYELEIAPEDWEWLNDNATLEQYVQGALLYDGEGGRERYENIGVRYKGGFGALQSCFDWLGRRTYAKLSIKVSFNEYDSAGRFHDLRKLQFHSMNKDPSQMRERIAYDLFRESGVRTARTAYARLFVNGEDLGLFVLVEQFDGSFTDRHFDPEGGDGNLYKEVWPMHGAEQPYVDALQTNEEVADVSGMTSFAAALAAAGDETFLDVLGEWTDLESMWNYVAVDRGLSHWDGITAWYCVGAGGAECFNHNFYWYEQESQDRMWLVPWDMDHSLTPSPWETYYDVPAWLEQVDDCSPTEIWPGVGVRAPSCDPLIDRIGRMGGGSGKGGWAEAGGRFLDGPFAEAKVLGTIDALEAQISDIVADDANGPGLTDFGAAVDELRALVPQLRARFETEIGR